MKQRKLIDETGNVYGKLTVVSRADNDKNGFGKWICKCDCGNKSIVAGINLRKEKGTRSCGCLKNEIMFTKRSGNAVFGIILRNIKSDCKKRNLPFNITLEDVKEITVQPCSYCKREPYELKCRYQRPDSTVENDCLLLNGIDRIIPSKGYTKGNITPCCKYCNRAKSDLTLDEFKNLIKLIYKNYINET
jgi:hypothetical protein